MVERYFNPCQWPQKKKHYLKELSPGTGSGTADPDVFTIPHMSQRALLYNKNCWSYITLQKFLLWILSSPRVDP